MRPARRTTLKVITGRPDLTPMIDVVFLLLIFFMLYSSFVQVSGIQVDLPEVTASGEGSIEKLVITVDNQNTFYFNERPMDWENLQLQLNQFLAKWQADTVIIRADRHTGYGEVARLLALARSLNLNVYLATLSAEEEGDDEFSELRR
jgi:biopolymer transport protein ExbD